MTPKFRPIASIRLLLSILSITILAVIAPSESRAQTPALDFNELGGGQNFYGGTYSLGWRFTANQDVVVGALGFYDSLKDGIAAAHEVGIYDEATCQLLAMTTVEPTDPLIGFFRYRDLAEPVTLPGGKDYYIAAVTNSGDPYAIDVTELIVDPAITFWGFAIKGFNQTVTSLQCPVGGFNLQGYKGDFGPSFLIGSGAAMPTPLPTPDGGRRPTETKIYCTRTGPNLETLRCNATVGDAGPPPVTLPTGSVAFTATDGFSPATSSCFPAGTQFNPLIGTCEAIFQVPFGWPIGSRLPISAQYEGSTIFAPSSATSDGTLSNCATDACGNAGNLGWNPVPSIVQDRLMAVVLCATGGTNPQGGRPVCSMQASASIELAKVLDGIRPDRLRQIAILISADQARAVRALDNLKKGVNKYNDIQLAKILNTNAANPGVRNRLLEQFLETGSVRASQLASLRKGALNARRSAGNKKKKAPIKIIVGKINAKLKGNTQKEVSFKVSKQAKAVTDVLRGADFEEVPMTVDITTKHIEEKKPLKATGTVDLILDQ